MTTTPPNWLRLEPVMTDPTLADGLAVRVADPLWLLALQSALGDLTGEDAASPILARIDYAAAPLTTVRTPGLAEPRQLTSPTDPLEMLVESERDPDPGRENEPRRLDAAHAGAHFLRLLRRSAGPGDAGAYVSALLEAYPLDPDGESAPTGLARVFSGHVPDGSKLYRDLDLALRHTTPPALPTQPPVGSADSIAVTAVALAWLSWYDATSGGERADSKAWDATRLEYAMTIGAAGPDTETELTTGAYASGSLDWLDFDLATSARVVSHGTPNPPAVPTTISSVTTLATPVRFAGMPNRRLFAFEDAAVNFGAITAPVESAITSLLVEFALRYGNDHFLAPLRLGVGTLCRVRRIVVTDTFGEQVRLRPVADLEPRGAFRLFEHELLGPNGPRDPLFVLFPTLVDVHVGQPQEEVHFLRDEAAEMVWAVERTAPDDDGRPIDRTADSLARGLSPTQGLSASASAPGTLRTFTYLIRTAVEDNWYPLVLPDDGSGARLRYATIHGETTPRGRILAELIAVEAGMPIEEISRSGVQVVRAWRFARGTDGSQLCWVGRTVRIGRGEGASGLRFDLAL